MKAVRFWKDRWDIFIKHLLYEKGIWSVTEQLIKSKYLASHLFNVYYRCQRIFESHFFEQARALENKSVVFFFFFFFFFFFSQFFSRNWRYRREVEGKWPFLILSTISTESRICRHLLSSLYLRCLPRVFNQGPCNYQTGIRWDLFASGNWYLTEGNYIVDIKYFINLSLTKCGFDLASP